MENNIYKKERMNKNSENSDYHPINNDKDKEINSNKEITVKNKNKKAKSSKHKHSYWPIIVLFLTLGLSIIFSLGSELILSGANLIVSLLILFIFIALAMFSDMIGVAVTAAEIEPFVAMSSRKVKGSKLALKMVRNADKLSSIFCDVIGDICGILSGAVGATIVAIISINGNTTEIIVASIISAVIAALTVFLKSIGKRIAINNANKLIFGLAKFLSFFKFGK